MRIDRLYRFFIVVMAVAATGCATRGIPENQAVAEMEAVFVDYTCRLPGGKVVITTDDVYTGEDKLEAIDPRLFMWRNNYKPAMIIAGRIAHTQARPEPIPMDWAVENALSQAVSGLTTEGIHRLSIGHPVVDGIPQAERYMVFARTMRRPKVQKMPRDQFVRLAKKEPEVGEVLFKDGNVPWKVAAMDESTVEVHYLKKEGDPMRLAFGMGTVHDAGDHFEVTLDVRPGDLVRIGGYLGQITEVNDTNIRVDFAHPLGGRTFDCAVTVKRAPESEAAGGKDS